MRDVTIVDYFTWKLRDVYTKETHLIAYDGNGMPCEENPIIGFYINHSDYRKLKEELDKVSPILKSLRALRFDIADRFMGFEIYPSITLEEKDLVPIRLKDKFPFN